MYYDEWLSIREDATNYMKERKEDPCLDEERLRMEMTDAEYDMKERELFQAILEKHPSFIEEIRADERAKAIKAFKDKVDYFREHYVDACSMCTKMNCEVCDIKEIINGLEQLKEGAENGTC